MQLLNKYQRENPVVLDEDVLREQEKVNNILHSDVGGGYGLVVKSLAKVITCMMFFRFQ